MRNLKTYWWVVGLFCLYIYPFKINALSLLNYIYIYAVPLGYLLLQRRILVKWLKDIHKIQKSLIIGISILVLLSLVIPILHSSKDFSFFLTITFILRRLILYLFLAVVVKKAYGEKASVEVFMYYYIIATVMYVCSTIILICIPSLKTYWLSLTTTSQEQKLLLSYGYFARIGWMGYSGFRNTFKCTLAFVCALSLNFEKKFMNKWVFFPSCIIIFIGSMFYGRTGLLVSFICFILALFIYKKVNKRLLLSIPIILVLVTGIIFGLKSFIPIMNEWYDWVSTPFINLFTKASFDNYSVNNMFKMIFNPGLSTLLFGDGFYTDPVNGTYYMATDLGFMRQILFWGLPITIYCYFITIQSFLCLGKEKMKITFLFICIFIFFEFKGEVYYEFIPLFLSMSFLNINNDSIYIKTDDALISVVMSTFKEKKEWISASIESILNQSYKNLEFIIVLDDPMNDELRKIVYDYAKKDKRIVVIENKVNLGLVESLNKGIAKAQGEYIARMDADDISISNRIEIQKAYLEKEHFDLIGTQIEFIDEDGNLLKNMATAMPTDDKNVKFLLKFQDCLAHPTWFGKKDVFINLNGYRGIDYCEDYDFLFRAATKGYILGNTDQVLLKYRYTQNSISRKNKAKQRLTSYYLRKNSEKINMVSPSMVEQYLSSNEAERLLAELNDYFSMSKEAMQMKKEKKYVLFLKEMIKIAFNKFGRKSIIETLIVKLWA